MYNNIMWLTMQSRVFFFVGVNMATWQQIKEGAEIFKGIFLEKIPPPRVAIFGGKKKEVDSTTFRPWVLHHSSL
jgi:hypothetical protein